MAKRVHELAKELGVKSTAIVSKCQAEGLPIKNHMSTLSAGLEATILEWFSEHAEGDQSITVQTTAPVDLAKVKTKKKRKPKAKPKAEPAEAAAADAGPQAPAAVTAQPIEAAAGPAAPAGPETPAAALPVPPAAGWAPTDQDLSAGAAAEDLAGAKGVRAARLAKPKRKSPKELATEGPEEPAAEG
ncbi:MAG: translation initiation factor IF-2 N-terminal domain-containing protein, partial [Sedimentisphaerales bacterium]|nr:translation initiation factor IF-2 N-terminal domain-containing protein [Sedimentisphaerales bacterium]